MLSTLPHVSSRSCLSLCLVFCLLLSLLFLCPCLCSLPSRFLSLCTYSQAKSKRKQSTASSVSKMITNTRRGRIATLAHVLDAY